MIASVLILRVAFLAAPYQEIGKPRCLLHGYREVVTDVFAVCVPFEPSIWRSDDTEDYAVGVDQQIRISLHRKIIDAEEKLSIEPGKWEKLGRRIVILPAIDDPSLLTVLAFKSEIPPIDVGLIVGTFVLADRLKDVRFSVDCDVDRKLPLALYAKTYRGNRRLALGDVVSRDYGRIVEFDCSHVIVSEQATTKNGGRIYFQSRVPAATKEVRRNQKGN